MVWFVDNGNVWEICMYGKYEILDQSNKQALYIVYAAETSRKMQEETGCTRVASTC